MQLPEQRYLRGTADYGLAFTSYASGDCVGYSDADWGGDLDDRKSTSGYLISGGAVSWRSKKQTCVALSTAEAEYVALASAAQEAIWIRVAKDINRKANSMMCTFGFSDIFVLTYLFKSYCLSLYGCVLSYHALKHRN